MKFCTHCGEVIEDDVVVCPKCGKALNSKTTSTSTSTVSYNTPNNNSTNSGLSNSSGQVQSVLMVFGILASLAVVVGVILLIVGGIQEYQFRQEYDLSQLSDAGINLVRKYSNYSNSINFLTACGICAGVGFLIDLILAPLSPYLIMLQKKGGK